MKPSKEVLSALASLEGQHDFEVLRTWLNRWLLRELEDCRDAHDEVLLRRHQGSAQVLTTLVEVMANARHLIAKS